MEFQNNQRRSSSTGPSDITLTSRRAPNPPEAEPPAGYALKTIIKREKRDEQIFDIDGTLWDVREARATKHGFDLLFGVPANSRLGRFIGPQRLLATPPLVAYWETNRTNEGAIYDLPAGRSTIKRLRKRLCMNFVTDRRNQWKKRAADLKTLPTNEFAERYQVGKEQTNAWRYLLVGRAVRPLDWWKHPEALAVLRNPALKLREIGQALNIGTSHANRLRARAAQIDPALLEQKVATPIPPIPLERKPAHPRPRTPFLKNPKQGEMFIGQGFWQREHKPVNAAPAKRRPLKTAQPHYRRIKMKHSHSQETAKRIGQMLLPFKARRGQEPHPVLFQVQDHRGTFYDVFAERATTHGFALLFGFPTRMHRRIFSNSGKPGLIATPELVAFWQAHRGEEGINFDLPAGFTTLVRARQKLGFNQKKEYQAQVQQRLADLPTLTVAEFAQKYNVTISSVYRYRRSLQRPPAFREEPKRAA